MIKLFYFCLRNTLNAYTSYLLGRFTVNCFTQSLKRIVGRLRPCFFDVCKPIFNDNICQERFKKLTN
jgi:hypothetical protein